MCVQSQLWQRHFGVCSKLKRYADSDDEDEMNNAVSVPPSSEIRNVMKRMRSYLDARSKGEMNTKMDDIVQFAD
ncbi:hypothetical protein TNCV_457181 [Trichonephila clavipes]|nr:hypothetical protein TNCV_457181 [Trichonephila clavipes]